MRQFSDGTLEKLVANLWQKFTDKAENSYPRDWDFNNLDQVTVEKNSPTSIVLNITAEYRKPTINSEIILALCDLLETKHIDVGDEIWRGGCETCDFGSAYGFVLKVRP